MRRLVIGYKGKSQENERGATAVVTAILMVVLLGFAAISVDVGMLYAERAQLQNGADSAALAVAYDCAKSTTSNGCGNPSSAAAPLANANANDGKTNTNSVTVDLVNRTVKVNVSSKSVSNPNGVQLMFASIFGIRSASVPATATATWPAPATLTTIPWSVGSCALQDLLTPTQKTALNSTGNFSVDPSKTVIYIRSDTNANYAGCDGTHGYASGGFGWLEVVGSGCQAVSSSAPYIVQGWTGNSSNKVLGISACANIFSNGIGKEMLIPIFSGSLGQGGNNAQYTIAGFAAFYLTGYHFNPPNYDGITPPACNGGNNCRGLYGYFTHYVSITDYIAMQPGSPSTTIRLIK
ncbi:pilus assembly protein TadG-related protein [Arthrobacter sp. ERGS1:01]|uniref:pilus assembly protein TadG-related protein n=1 Tax=Arthrobacter sp. ERGS1:01 TaxID=1704044 RepID=UPI0009E8BCCB|nr:pilus assembly protein TadG-related protein [Arthrobacter sp. ERGS1:01]